MSTSRVGELPNDLSCYRCGYNLRGLDAAGRCPECSAAIDESIRRQAEALAGRSGPLDRADPAWLRTLARACALIVLAAAARVGTELLAIWPTNYMSSPLRIAVFLTPYVMVAVGIWLSAAREPLLASRDGVWLSAIIRVAAACWLLAVVGFSATSRWNDLTVRVQVGLAGLLGWCVFWRFRGLAARAAIRVLAGRCAALACVVAAACAVWVWGDAHSVGELYSVQMGHDWFSVYVPLPVVGPCTLLVKLPHSAMTFPRQADFGVFVSALLAALSVLAIITLEHVRRTLKRVAEAAAKDSVA